MTFKRDNNIVRGASVIILNQIAKISTYTYVCIYIYIYIYKIFLFKNFLGGDTFSFERKPMVGIGESKTLVKHLRVVSLEIRHS